MKKLLPLIWTATLVYLLSGCNDDDAEPVNPIGVPSNATILLNKVSYEDSLYDVYEYNDNNEVTKITTYNNQSDDPLEYSMYFYKNGRISRREFYRQIVDFQLSAYETFEWQGLEVTNEVYVLYYDGNNDVVSEELFQQHLYELNKASELIRSSEFQNIPNIGIIKSSYTDFMWKNGNVTETKTWQLTDDASEYLPQGEITLKYDDKLNPYRILPHEIFRRPWLNNITEETDTENDRVTTYSYTYNDLGYIQSAVKQTVYNDDPNLNKQTTVLYEYISANP